MKKLMGILLAASMVFSLAACGSTADTAASSAAGTIATAAFFAPEMVTSPFSILPPLITYLSLIHI